MIKVSGCLSSTLKAGRPTQVDDHMISYGNSLAGGAISTELSSSPGLTGAPGSVRVCSSPVEVNK